MIKLSIVIPVYNVGEYIGKTLESLIYQYCEMIEIIIINDGSTDDSLEVINSKLLNSNIKYKIINNLNKGVSFSRNVGIDLSVGDYIYFLDGDDIVSEYFIDTLLQTISNKNYDAIIWGYNFVNSDYIEITNYFSKYIFKFESLEGYKTIEKFLKKEISIWTCSIAFKRKVIIDNDISFNENCKNGEDQEFYIKALSHSNQVRFLNKILSYYLQRINSISHEVNYRKFDAIIALFRVTEYLKKHTNKYMKQSVYFLEKTYINDLFISIFIQNIIIQRKNNKANIYRLIHLQSINIKSIYPQLIDNMKIAIKKSIKKTIFKDLKKFLKYSLLSLNFNLYIYTSIKIKESKWLKNV